MVKAAKYREWRKALRQNGWVVRLSCLPEGWLK
jgi:hypothetical protein